AIFEEVQQLYDRLNLYSSIENKSFTDFKFKKIRNKKNKLLSIKNKLLSFYSRILKQINQSTKEKTFKYLKVIDNAKNCSKLKNWLHKKPHFVNQMLQLGVISRKEFLKLKKEISKGPKFTTIWNNVHQLLKKSSKLLKK